jgi:serine protease AprX
MLSRPLSTLRVLVATFGLALVATPVLAQGSQGKLDLALRNDTGDGVRRVIIRTRPGTRALIRRALSAHGDRVQAEHPSIDAITADVHAEDLLALAADSSIESISSDAEVGALAAPIKDLKPARGIAEHNSLLRTTLGLEATAPDGAGIGVAIVDSGITPMASFDSRITAFFDFTDGQTRQTAPFDDYGHGTHVAGLIGAQQLAGDYEYRGIAPGVHFVGIKVLDRKGKGRTSDVIRALEFVRANRQLLNVRIVNLSLGHPILQRAEDDPLVQAVEAAVRDGLIVFASAGNFGTSAQTGAIGYAGITSPGNAPSAITVGAVDTKHTVTRSDDVVTKYSSRGPTWYDAFAKPDIVAPGHTLVSAADINSYLYATFPALRYTGSGQRRYLALSGTSMATGVASGVAAVLLSANGSLTANSLKAVLQYTALPLGNHAGAQLDALTQGTGGINADGALRLAVAIGGYEAPVATWECAAITHESTIGGESRTWADNIIWGDRELSGEALFGNGSAWVPAVVWGADNIVWSENIVWAENIVWSENIVWAENIVWGDGLLTALDGSDNIVWSNVDDADNIVWADLGDDNIVWSEHDNVVWGLLR